VLDRVRFSVVRAFEREKLRAAGYARRRGPRRIRFLALAAFLLLGAAGAAVFVRVYRGAAMPPPKPAAVVTQSSPARIAAPAPALPSAAELPAVAEPPPIAESEPDERRAVAATDRRRVLFGPVRATPQEAPPRREKRRPISREGELAPW
jgi:hypothetical protein